MCVLFIFFDFTVQGFDTKESFTKFTSVESNLKELLAGALFSGDLKKDSKNIAFDLRFHADPINRNPNQSDQFGSM